MATKKYILTVVNGRKQYEEFVFPPLTTEQIAAVAALVPATDISGKVDKASGQRLITIADLLAIEAAANSNITDSEIQSKIVYPGFNSGYRTLLDSTGSHIAAKAAGTYGIPQGNPLAVSGTGTLYALNTIYIAGTDYPIIAGKAPKLRVRCIIACNDVAPFTGTFKIGLHPVTRPATSGGAGLCIYTIGSPIAASQVTGTNLAADSLNNLVGSDFDLPADGFYVLAVVTSATMATSSHCHISASLQIRNN